MFLFLKLLKESFLFAMHAIVANKLRTILSLLGITIGIFAIISVFTVVDSLEKSIRQNVESLGDNVLFVQKWPWTFEAGFPWWKYVNRPVPVYKELTEIQNRSNAMEAACYMISFSKTLKHDRNSLDNTVVLAASHDYERVMSIELSEGRYFTREESAAGRKVVIIGSTVAEEFFGQRNPLGKQVKLMGRKFTIAGIFKREGEDTFGNSPDEQILIPINSARSLLDLNSERYNPIILVKAKPLVSNDELRDELTGIMRSVRRLKPSAEDNFAINEISMLNKGFEQLFSTLTLAGWIIGIFSLLVGGFGIANIMFVSVRERTNIIGIQKSLGAKRFFILFQFLFESVFLCLIGGALGLFLVYIGTLWGEDVINMELFMTRGNIMLGLTVSLMIGIISGFLPAFSAARMDPVVAIRTNA